MDDRVPFSELLWLLESQGWTLHRIDAPYRIFIKGQELPILIPVYDKKVEAIYVDKVRKILGTQGGSEDES